MKGGEEMFGIKKIVFLVVMVLTASIGFAQTQDMKADSKILRVTVYPDSALVTRSAHLEINPGVHQVYFDDIIPEIDENSLTVSGEGTAQVKLHGAFLKRDYMTEITDERIKALSKQIEALTDQITQENNKIQTIQLQKDFLKSIQMYSGQQIPKDLVTKMPTVTELGGLLNFIAEQHNNLDQQQTGIHLKLRELREQKTALENELGQLRQPASRMKRSIVVKVEGIKKGTLNLNVSYLVRGVFWFPLYDARASVADNKVELTSFGVVKQTTGEDWTDVSLALSTAKPSISGQLPYVAPWFLRPYQPVAPAIAESAVLMRKERAAGGMQIAQYEPYYLETDYETKEKAPQKVAQMALSDVSFKGVSVSYQMPGQVTVKSDGTEHKLPISSQMLNAAFSYSAFPRMSPYAYLGTRVRNDKDLQLLAGEVNIFLDGDYVGHSRIQNIGPGEEFDLSLGIDENVKVERKEVEKKVDDVLIAGIASPNRKTVFKYRLSAENYKNKPINMILYEATPVSQNERIKTKVTDINIEPKEKDWNKRKGIWRWEFSLEPKMKKEIIYSFFIEHPREMQVEGM